MKRIVPLLLALAMVFSLCACGGGNKDNDNGNNTPVSDNSSVSSGDDASSVSSNSDDAITGHWDMIALADQENNSEITPVSDSDAYVEFDEDGSGILSLSSDDRYTFDWEPYPDLTAKLDSGVGYKLDLDGIPNNAYATLSEVSGKDTVIVLIDDIKYSSIFQR